MTTTITKAGPYAWRYDYTGTAPFDLYHDGRVIAAQTTDTSIVLNGDDDEEPPALEIVDADATATPQSVRYSPLYVGQFRGDAAMAYYAIEQYIGSAWTQIREIPEDGNGGYRRFEVGPLDDVTTHRFRVTPYDGGDNAGYPLVLEVFMRRNPPEPSVSVTYDSGTGDITIAAR
jgi:hypothetical protein